MEAVAINGGRPVFDLSTLARFWPAAAFLAWTLFAGIAGWKTGREQAQARCTATIAALNIEETERLRLATQEVLERFRAAQARGDALEERLAEKSRTLELQTREHAREIKRLTTGRPCLNAGTVRLLNDATIRLSASPAGVPPPTGGTPAANAPAASDTDVAGWIDDAGRQYETCRNRLDALIDWHVDGPRAPPAASLPPEGAFLALGRPGDEEEDTDGHR